MTKLSYIIIGVVIVVCVILTFWYFLVLEKSPEMLPDSIPSPSDIVEETPDTETQMPNPASVHCIEKLGGELQIVETDDGQVGVCHLPDDRWCDEWELYRTGMCVLPEGLSDAMLYSKG